LEIDWTVIDSKDKVAEATNESPSIDWDITVEPEDSEQEVSWYNNLVS
jgi:hypothetical protein